MIFLLRIVATVIAAVTAIMAERDLANFVVHGHDMIDLGIGLFEAAVCLSSAWFAWKGEATNVRPRVGRALRYAFLIGAISFFCGFCGPLVFAPQANQGPLLGIFVTGPIGFFVGLAIGALLPPRRVAGAPDRPGTSG